MIQNNLKVSFDLVAKKSFVFFDTSKHVLMAYLFFIFFTSIQAQNSNSLQYFQTLEAPDSILFDTINAYYDVNIFSHPDSVLPITDYHFKKAQKANNLRETIRALDTKALTQYLMEEFNLSLETLGQTLEFAKQLGDQEQISKIQNNMGNIYLQQQMYVESFRRYNLSLPYFREKKDYQTEGDIINNIGLIYRSVKNFDRALEYFEKALELYGKSPNHVSDGNIYSNIGSIKLEQGKQKEAISYFDKAIEIFESSEYPIAKIDAYLLYARALNELGMKERAIQYSKEGIELSEKMQIKSKIVEHKIQRANFIIEDDLLGANKIAKEIQNISDEGLSNEIKMKIYELLYKCQKSENNIPSALKMHEKFKLHSDSLRMEEDQTVFIKQAIEFEYNEQLHQNQLNFQEEQNRLKQTQTKRVFFITLLCLILIFSILFFAQNRYKKQKENQYELLQEIEKLKNQQKNNTQLQTEGFQLDRSRIEQTIGRNINETDWKVLNILLDDPVISNKAIAEKAFMSKDGIGSSLRRMYQSFEIKESRYMKISLLMEVIKMSK